MKTKINFSIIKSFVIIVFIAFKGQVYANDYYLSNTGIDNYANEILTRF